MTMRSVDTRFWSDTWIRKLNSLDRYMMLYFLTNEHTNWCGIYEVDIAMIAFESGIDKEDLDRSIFPRLLPKVIYFDGWVYIPNFKRYHANKTEATQLGYERALKQVPERIRLKIREIEQGGVVPPFYPSSAFAFALPKGESKDSQEVQIIPNEDPEGKPPKEKKDTTYEQLFALFPEPQRAWRRNRTQINAAKALLAEQGIEKCHNAIRFATKNKDESFCPVIHSPYDLDTKWQKLQSFRDKR